MANPKKKHTRMRTDLRRHANWRITAPSMSKCSHCGAPSRPHHICTQCGFYGGELMIPRKLKKKDEGQAPQG